MIEGYAAVFYNASADDRATEYYLGRHAGSDYYERILPNAFTQAIQRDDVYALLNHNPDNILGRSTANTLELYQDQVGLGYRVRNIETPLQQTVQGYQERGELTGSSFQFVIAEGGEKIYRSENGEMIREISNVELRDVGPVTFPAYSGTHSRYKVGQPEIRYSRERRTVHCQDAEVRSHMRFALNKMRIEALWSRT